MAAQARTFRELCLAINKDFFRGPWGERWQGAIGDLLDSEMSRLYDAVHVRWPHFAPADALYYLGAERNLERVPQETEGQYRDRLWQAWRIWQRSGSAEIHRESLGWTGLRGVAFHRRAEWSTPPAVGSQWVQAFARAVWSQGDVTVAQPHPWVRKKWGAAPPWGGGTWGSTMTRSEVDLLKRLLRTHKSAHDTVTYMHVIFDQNAVVWGGWVWGDGHVWATGTEGVMPVVVGDTHWQTRGLL